MTLLRKNLRTAIGQHDRPALDRWLRVSARRPETLIRAQLTPPDAILPAWLYAAQYGNPAVLEALAPWVDVHARDGVGNSALALAAIAGRVDNVRALLGRWGVDPGLRNRYGDDALILATSNRRPAVVEVLLGEPRALQQVERAFVRGLTTGGLQPSWTCADLLALRLPASTVLPVVHDAGLEQFPRWRAQQEGLALRAIMGGTGQAPAPGTPSTTPPAMRTMTSPRKRL